MTSSTNPNTGRQDGRLVLNTISNNRGQQARLRNAIRRQDSFDVEDPCNTEPSLEPLVEHTAPDTQIRDVVVAFEHGTKPEVLFIRIANDQPFTDAIDNYRKEAGNNSEHVLFQYNGWPISPEDTPLQMNGQESLFVLRVMDLGEKSGMKRKRGDGE